MSRSRLRKKDRVKMAGKGCRVAVWGWGTKKRADKVFRKTKKD